jgi:hypothetical protein
MGNANTADECTTSMSQHITVLAEAATGKETARLARHNLPDLVLIT